MKKPIVAIDIDDVLAHSVPSLVAFSNQTWDMQLAVNDYDEHWGRFRNVDDEEMARRSHLVHEQRLLADYESNQAALPVLARLKKSYTLVVLTSRRLSVREDTVAWLGHNFPGIFEESAIYFAGIWDNVTAMSYLKTKADVAQAIGANYLIDDQLKHALGVADIGIKAVLYGDYKWNQTEEPLPELVTRVSDWQEVGGYIERERL